MGQTPKEDLLLALQDPEFVRLFGSERAKTELAFAVNRARRQRGMTQRELADRLGRTQPYIAKLESGEANPTIGAVGSLLAVLGLRLVIHTEPLVRREATSAPETKADGEPYTP